jgi:hypothetical protein
MRSAVFLALMLAALVKVPGMPATAPVRAQAIDGGPVASAPWGAGGADDPLASEQAYAHVRARRDDDLVALAAARPGYPFWRHIFSIPDGHVAFGSASDGRLLAVFPVRGDWLRDAEWTDPSLATLLAGRRLPRRLNDRRDLVAGLLEQTAGPVVHNQTRGLFVLPHARRYGGFLREWGAIYERFGVPAEVGLAQAMVESGLSPTRRSPARAIGFCQWLLGNWRRLDRLTPDVLEAYNQTTQAAYCAAYLTILATKYGSFIPALSEHHSGGTNIGRTLINGERLGGEHIREQYFLGSQFARDLRQISLYGYRELYRTYGPRSYFYSEMVFANASTVAALTASTPQVKIYAMRPPRAISLADIARRTKLPVDEVRRYNPALRAAVPAGAALYLPMYVEDFGRDVAFWHRPPSPAFASVLNEFLRLDGGTGRWDDHAFEPVLRRFVQEFRETDSEEGRIMATVLAYAIEETALSRRNAILDEFRASDKVQRLFDRAVVARGANGPVRAALEDPSLPEADPNPDDTASGNPN